MRTTMNLVFASAAALALFAVGLIIVNRPAAEDEATAAAKANARRVVAELNRKNAEATQACRDSHDSLRAEYARRFAAGQFAEAVKALGDCPRLLGDQAMQVQLLDADARDRRRRIEDTRASAEDRVAALAGFAKLHPDDARTRYGTLGVQLQAKADAEAAARVRKARDEYDANRLRLEKAEDARRKKEGVTIGMSAEDVLRSNWGRPQKVNRTTTARGTDEQWVYPGGYLYLRDGVLYSIQN